MDFRDTYDRFKQWLEENADKKGWLVALAGLLSVGCIVGITIGVFSSSLEEERDFQSKPKDISKLLSRYYLYPSKDINTQDREYIISGEKINLSGDKKKLVEDLMNTELFKREEESIQVEVNKLYH